MNQTIQRPLITEKTLKLAASGWYTFAVDVKARKETIASAVKQLYKVDVIEVRTMVMHGKTKRAGRKATTVKRPDWKKAFVQLKKGQKIDAFEAHSYGDNTTS